MFSTSCSDGWYSLFTLLILVIGIMVLHITVSVITQRDGDSVLTLAAWRGDSKVVSLLLEAGADIHYHNKVYMHFLSAISICTVPSTISTHLPNIYTYVTRCFNHHCCII